MTSNQRRPGFRLPWASETEAAEAEAAAAADGGQAAEMAEAVPEASRSDVEPTIAAAEPGPSGDAASGEAASDEAAASEPADPAAAEFETEPAGIEARPPTTPEATTAAVQPESSAGFMRDLVAAMRRVADETRQSGLSELRTKAEEQVRTLEAESEQRRGALSARAEADVAGVGEWARAETERIKQEAEQRVVARRAQLDQQLAAETTRAEAEAKALRDRVAEYERELDAYHAQLSDIADPAAFAAAAKRMPPPPTLGGDQAPPVTKPRPSVASTNGAASPSPVHPAEEEVLASRLAELDAKLAPPAAEKPSTEAATEPAAADPAVESSSTEILVKGLGSFGAITGFRQALASVDGVEGVSLSLGPTGEFVFRAIHATGFDVGAAITTLEGDAARIEPQPEGGLRVTLDRAR